ncbi:MAG: hypothetical protein EOS07_07400 [Mesorhizobium sp.]|uniref:hypothetical protein n=1 Tax=Mesorhizobium sp. TaxID=1871066 RepID=UPI000FE319A6|nr:hypothetical protein [Mesorhizobium sp.]RWO10978.1 MAG: hypothetical protein EOS07_07400 [Mesorhizobium sp.]RWQ22711.1 MAG: hypothetical protein EOR92_06775 [Mesorhizobium sp.]RWQ55242.1 MAG: hypothetical protein EOS84_11840 [Mesorhizobium sp.]TIS35908.1 MAG: hypothetical protein E5W95_24610 [Mesorhizobium sp.]
MTERPDFLVRGERARLFPVLADTSKEGRTLSILLACLETVEEFGKSLLADLGVKAGGRTKIEAYTEVVLKKGGEKTARPDGLLVLKTGAKSWTALVEAKVGNSELTVGQLDSYLEIAKMNGIDALITISNQFAPLPSHHPVQLSNASLKKATLLHWSWMYVLTQATLQLGNSDIEDKEQRVILNEMVRFLSHPSAGVKSFDQMPASWTTVAGTIQAGGTVSAKSNDAQEVVGAWYQETRDLCLILSRQLGEEVDVKVPRIHVSDPVLRLKTDAQGLASENCLRATFVVPNTAAAIEISADFRKRSVFASMRVAAPTDRKSTKARLNWLLRQLQKSKPDGIHIRLFWPGRGPFTQHPLTALRDRPEAAEGIGKVVTSFEVVFARDLGGRFAQRKNFIIDLEQAIPDFYEQVGQHLKAWQPQAPKIKEDRLDATDVSTEALREEAEDAVADRNVPAE